MGDRLGIPGAVSFYTAASLQETWACNYVDARAHVNVLLVSALDVALQAREKLGDGEQLTHLGVAS